MKINFAKKFTKSYRIFSKKQREKIKKVIAQFRNNPHHPSLRNHALHGQFKGLRAISVDRDMRIIFREMGGYVEVLFLQVGGHSRVYGG